MYQDSLERFLEAQNSRRYGGSYEDALAEMRAGKKYTHWIWYIYPQLRGLGRSEYSFLFGIRNKEEAEAYLAHEILGARLIAVTNVLLNLPETNIFQIMSAIDASKLRSCMTLFANTENAPEIFDNVLQKYFNGKPDRKTLAMIGHTEA
ncbi:MAG: DUF1810 domain-containing protein [Clostridia bacterium]|nr:DUF1810 domain-containing protein [Clostridia bacterium]